MKLSDWQDGVPKEEGVYQILVPEHEELYFARFKHGYWDCGTGTLENKLSTYWHKHTEYPSNNDPQNPRKWRGIVDSEIHEGLS